MKACLTVIAVTTCLLSSVEQAPADEAFARASGCFDCHQLDERGTGPSFREIAGKYRNDADARTALIGTVKNGSKGQWLAVSKGVPMPAYSPRLSDQDIERLVDWILAL